MKISLKVMVIGLALLGGVNLYAMEPMKPFTSHPSQFRPVPYGKTAESVIQELPDKEYIQEVQAEIMDIINGKKEVPNKISEVASLTNHLEARLEGKRDAVVEYAQWWLKQSRARADKEEKKESAEQNR